MIKSSTAKPSQMNEWTHAVLRRMEHIERCLFWRGELKRADLMDEFGITQIQAARDFRDYMERFPKSMTYNASQRRYVPEPGFKPKLITPTTLDEFAGMPSASVPVAQWPLPTRNAAPEVLMAMVKAVREHQKIEVLYQSMTGKESTWRYLSPHAFASDNDRWHVRAFCHSRNQFRDFVLGRILSTRNPRATEVDPLTDEEWHTMVEVLVTPNPSLELDQRKAIAAEYVITEDSMELILKVRKSMLFYLQAQFDNLRNDAPAANQLFVVKL